MRCITRRIEANYCLTFSYCKIAQRLLDAVFRPTRNGKRGKTWIVNKMWSEKETSTRIDIDMVLPPTTRSTLQCCACACAINCYPTLPFDVFSVFDFFLFWFFSTMIKYSKYVWFANNLLYDDLLHFTTCTGPLLRKSWIITSSPTLNLWNCKIRRLCDTRLSVSRNKMFDSFGTRLFIGTLIEMVTFRLDGSSSACWAILTKYCNQSCSRNIGTSFRGTRIITHMLCSSFIHSTSTHNRTHSRKSTNQPTHSSIQYSTSVSSVCARLFFFSHFSQSVRVSGYPGTYDTYGTKADSM